MTMLEWGVGIGAGSAVIVSFGIMFWVLRSIMKP